MAYFSRYNTTHSFLHTLAFEPAQDLNDGLADDIASEREEQGITLEETADADALQEFWSTAVEDARKDPKWNFSGEEENEPLY